jgi:8-oxo-dGTP pyrophosphatase MutT (NUDIX family)
MKKEFTATVYIIKNNQILLHPHPKHGKWLPPGGHIEKNETPPDAAKREVMEECGIEIEFITQENIWVDAEFANSIERPYMCLLENITKPDAHQHIDFIYLARLKDAKIPFSPFRWYTFENALKLDLYKDTILTIKHLEKISAQQVGA